MCFYRGHVHRHGFRDRLGSRLGKGRVCLGKLSKLTKLSRLCCYSVIHSHWLGSGEQVNDDPDARTVAAEDEGPQTVVAGQGGDHAVAVGAEVHGGDIRTKSAGYLLESVVRWRSNMTVKVFSSIRAPYATARGQSNTMRPKSSCAPARVTTGHAACPASLAGSSAWVASAGPRPPGLLRGPAPGRSLGCCRQ